MRVLFVDQYASCLFLILRAIDEGHDVRVWMPKANGVKTRIGEGFFKMIPDWKPHMKWADLILTTGNDVIMRELTPFFNQNYPIFGCNPRSAQLELDRELGQKICQDYGIETLPFEMFSSYKDAAAYVEKTQEVFVCKPWGGTEDKSLSYVSNSPEDMIWRLGKWEEKGKLKGSIILQKRVAGIEIAVGGWFGKGGWSRHICENFEEKKLMNEGLGCNTGEQGTTLRYTTQSKLFNQCLEPITGYLHEIGYVGYVDQNCMVDTQGNAWPLEFTMRYGYPLLAIQEALHQGDSMQWRLDALQGRDTLEVSSQVAVGVVFTHGQYPYSKGTVEEDDGIPFYGMTHSMEPQVQLWQARMGTAPVTIGNKIKEIPIVTSAGAIMAVVTGTGKTIHQAAEKAYNVAWKLKPPTNRMMRTDISKRLEKQLPELQKKGFATDLEY